MKTIAAKITVLDFPENLFLFAKGTMCMFMIVSKNTKMTKLTTAAAKLTTQQVINLSATVRILHCIKCVFMFAKKLYIPSTLNTDLIFLHPQWTVSSCSKIMGYFYQFSNYFFGENTFQIIPKVQD